MPLEDRSLTQQEGAAYAREREAFNRDLPAARYWRRAAVVLAEETLLLLKAALFDPVAEPIDTRELAAIERMLAELRHAGDAALVAEYRKWRQREPQLTAGMVRAAWNLEQVERRALKRFIADLAAEGPA